MNHLLLSRTILLAFIGLNTGCSEKDKKTESTRPNVVLIVSDDQGAGDFSLYGNPYVQTKHIDHLANQSARFELNPVVVPV